MKSIALLINSLGSGGAQRQIIILANLLAIAGYRINLIYYSDDSDLISDVNLNFVNVVRIKKSNFALSKIFNIIRGIKKYQPDVLVTFVEGPCLFGFIYKHLNPRVKWIPSERNMDTNINIWFYLRKLLLYYPAHTVVANSFSQGKNLVAIGLFLAKKTKVIVNCISEKFTNGSAVKNEVGGKFNFLVLARLSTQKNPMLLIEALKLLDKEYSSRLAIKWFGHEEINSDLRISDLNIIAKNNGIPIIFMQNTNDVLGEIDKCDALILCSKHEGTPNVIVEAMARKRHVIASNVSDVGVYLSEGRGFLFESDSSLELANSIIKFMNSSKIELDSMAENSFKFIESNFSEKEFLKKYIDVIEG